MPSTLFEASHVYPINRNHPIGARFPFEYFMCFTQPDFNQPDPKFNVVGFPILIKPERTTPDRRLRMSLQTSTSHRRGQLPFAKLPVLAGDLIQPIPNGLLINQSVGRLMDDEVEDLKALLLEYFAL